MKTIIILCVLTFTVATPRSQAMFGRVQAERQSRQAAEQRVIKEQQANGQLLHTNEGLHTIISILSAGVVTALVMGAAIGSKTRRDAR